MISHSPAAERMNCMEVWGGMRPANKHFQMPGLDLWIWSQPLDAPCEVGGPVHYLSSCASGRITRIVLADVCGVGTVITDLASRFRDLMVCNVNLIKQTRLVRDMSEQLSEFSAVGGLATALISTYFASTRSFSICNAGHPPPFLYRAEDREWSVMKHSAGEGNADTPLGVLAEVEYEQVTTTLRPGDMVLSYSNQLTEILDTDGQILGVDGLLRMVSNLEASEPATIIPDLLARVSESDIEVAKEDATLCLCRATERSVGWKDSLKAPFRMLAPVSDKTSLS